MEIASYRLGPLNISNFLTIGILKSHRPTCVKSLTCCQIRLMERPGDKMRAAVIPKVRNRWQVEEVPVPKPVANQVLIKIHASGLCYSDVHLTNGDLPIPIHFPLTTGHEPVGEIVELGDGVSIRKERR